MTLIELITVIAILGIVAAAVALFIRAPIESYTDSARRVELVDTADGALRFMLRDVRGALPNSIRVQVVGSVWYLEFLPVVTGGRYRASGDGNAGTAEETLDFTAADTRFDTLGPLSTQPREQIAAGHRVVIYNLGSVGADAYAGDNTAVIASTGAGALANEARINFAAKQFPLASPGNRFQVVSGPVSYVCDPTTNRLTRVTGYAISPAQPTAPGGTSTLLAQDVSDCSMVYSPAAAQGRGLLAVRLQLARAGETVSLLHQMRTNNVP